MFRVKAGQKEIGFSFEHIRGFGEMHGISDATFCYLHISEQDMITEVALCSNHDNFNKEIGRKVSLGRALAKAKLTKLERAAVWSRYINRDLNNEQFNEYVGETSNV